MDGINWIATLVAESFFINIVGCSMFLYVVDYNLLALWLDVNSCGSFFSYCFMLVGMKIYLMGI